MVNGDDLECRWSESVLESDSNHPVTVTDVGDLRLAWLATFVSVSRQPTRSAAAKELGITQGTVTKHIRSLEGWCRRLLFYHDSVPPRLTDYGDDLLKAAGFVLGDLADIRGSIPVIEPKTRSKIAPSGLRVPPAVPKPRDE